MLQRCLPISMVEFKYADAVDIYDHIESTFLALVIHDEIRATVLLLKSVKSLYF